MLGLGALRGFDGICLMGETSGYIVDPRSAAAVLTVLSNLLKIPVDPTQLNDRAAEMEKVIEGLVENERMQKDEELSYIG
jgi:proteasome assembly chaperone (PAC2) family protein